MLILCTGMIRSGSTWSYNACKNLLAHVFGDAQVHGGYSETLTDWRRFESDPTKHAVVKCHVLDEASRTWIEQQRTPPRFVYTLRDPREIFASASAAFNMPYEVCRDAIARSLDFLEWQRQLGGVAVVPYRAIVDAPLATVTSLAKHLRLTVSDETCEAIAHACSMDRMKAEVTDRFDQHAEADVYRDEKYTYHRPTLLHATHFRKADAPDWPQLLTSTQQNELMSLLKDWNSVMDAKSVVSL